MGVVQRMASLTGSADCSYSRGATSTATRTAIPSQEISLCHSVTPQRP